MTYYYFLATMGYGRFGWKTFVDYGLYSDVLTAEAFYYGSLHCLSPDFEFVGASTDFLLG